MMLDQEKIIVPIFPKVTGSEKPEKSDAGICVPCAWCKNVYAVRELDENNFPKDETKFFVTEQLRQALRLGKDNTSTICDTCFNQHSGKKADFYMKKAA